MANYEPGWYYNKTTKKKFYYSGSKEKEDKIQKEEANKNQEEYKFSDKQKEDRDELVDLMRQYWKEMGLEGKKGSTGIETQEWFKQKGYNLNHQEINDIWDEAADTTRYTSSDIGKAKSSLKKGDIYENEYGTKVEIMEVDDKGQTLHKFTQKDGKTDYKNFDEKDVNSMLKHNNYKKVSQDDIDNTYFNNYKKDQERLDQAREKMSRPIEKKEKTKEELEKENLLSGIPQRKEIFPNEYLARDYEKLQNDSQIGNKERWSQAYENEVREYGKQLKQDNSNDKYKAYYKEEHLGEPSNYKEGDKIEYKSGYGEKLTGTIVREATDKEKEFQMNKNLKGYVVKDEFGEHIVPDTRIQVGKTIAEANKAYKDNKPIVDSNKGKEYVVYDDKQMKWVPSSSLKKSNNGPKTSSEISSKFSNRLIPEGSNYLYDPEILPKAEREYKNSKGDRKQFIERMSDELEQQDARIYFNKFKEIDQLEKKSNKKSKSQIAKERLEEYKENLEDPSKSKVTKNDFIRDLFKKKK